MKNLTLLLALAVTGCTSSYSGCVDYIAKVQVVATTNGKTTTYERNHTMKHGHITEDRVRFDRNVILGSTTYHCDKTNQLWIKKKEDILPVLISDTSCKFIYTEFK